MAREINLTDFGDHFEEYVQDVVELATMEWTARVKEETPVFNPNEGEKGVGGSLRNAWQTDIKKFKGTISNNLPYAEPVCYGTNLPPSWGDTYRTRQDTKPGFPELIGKELESYVRNIRGR